MRSAKPYDISKNLVWEAYRSVKTNGGAAGVDKESIEAFEVRLKDNLCRTDTEEVWWNADIGRTDGFGSGCTSGG